MKIIYLTDSGTVAVVHPSPEYLVNFSVRDIALKDVPAGKRFKLVDESEIPATREERLAWVVHHSELTDGIGGNAKHHSAKGR